MYITGNREIISIINDLVRINNDRIQWYARALQVLVLKPEDRDLESVFAANKRKIECHNAFLAEEVRDLGVEETTGRADATAGADAIASADTADANGLAGASFFKGDNRHAMLINCECGELAAQRAYQAALENPHLPGYLQELLGVQREELEKIYRRIGALKITAF